MRARLKETRWLRSACAVLVGLALTAACACGQASPAELQAYRTLRGALVAAETSAARPRGRYAEHRVRLMSSTGLVAMSRLLRPLTSRGDC